MEETMKNCTNRFVFALCAAFYALLVVALAACPEDEKQASFVPGPTNPFITDRFTADPAAFVDNGTVYLVCGEDVLPPGFESENYRIKQWLIYSTKDMKTFKFENVLMKSEDFSYGNANTAWASQAIKGLDGMYYFYGTVEGSIYGQVVSVARADAPTGPYRQAGTSPLVTSNMVSRDLGETYLNIDPTVFIDDDKTAWLAWGQVKPCIAKLKRNMTELDRETGTGVDPAKKIRFLFPDDWTSEHKYTEGPFLYKRKNARGENVYYMIYASMVVKNGSDFAETISYSMAKEDPDHPGLDYLIGKEGVWSDGVPMTGHAPGLDGNGNCYTIHPAVLDFNGQTYFFYHNAALRVTQEDGTVWGGNTGRRSLCVDYLYFNDDGTIQFVDVRNPAGLSVPPKE